MKKIRSQKREVILARRQLNAKKESNSNIARFKLKKIRNKIFKNRKPIHLKEFYKSWKKVKTALSGRSMENVNINKLIADHF